MDSDLSIQVSSNCSEEEENVPMIEERSAVDMRRVKSTPIPESEEKFTQPVAGMKPEKALFLSGEKNNNWRQKFPPLSIKESSDLKPGAQQFSPALY